MEMEKRPAFLDDMDDCFSITAISWLALWILTVQKKPSGSSQALPSAQKRSYEYGRHAFDKYVERYGRDSGRIDLLTKMVGTKEGQPLTDKEISNEPGRLLLATTDMTVVVPTRLLPELAQRPEWQNKTRDEIRHHHVEFVNGKTKLETISESPILNSFVIESMRFQPNAIH